METITNAEQSLAPMVLLGTLEISKSKDFRQQLVSELEDITISGGRQNAVRSMVFSEDVKHPHKSMTSLKNGRGKGMHEDLLKQPNTVDFSKWTGGTVSRNYLKTHYNGLNNIMENRSKLLHL